jgi:hypothetical protein
MSHLSQRLEDEPVVLVQPKKSTLPDNIYINLQLRGTQTTNKYSPHTRATFDQSFTETILNNCEEYYSSMITASIPTHTIPLAIFNVIQPGLTQSDPNLSELYLSFGYSGNYYGTYITYVPSTDQPAPGGPSTNGGKQVASPYYNIYNYNQLCRMINSTLSVIYASFFAAHPGINGLLNTDVPYMIFNNDTNKFSLIYSKKFIGSGISLYFNDSFDTKFGGFDKVFYGVSGNGRDNAFLFIDSKNNGYDVNNNCNCEQYISTNTWQTINQLIFVSTSMRTRGEYLGYSNNAVANVGSILFSLNPTFDTLNEQKSRLTYTTNGNYRLVDIIGKGSLNTINIAIYYTDSNDNTYPLTLSPLETCTVKLGFFRKSLFLNWG